GSGDRVSQDGEHVSSHGASVEKCAISQRVPAVGVALRNLGIGPDRLWSVQDAF
ncbi:MAG: hypothetical protein ACJAV2_003974, partial [Myxococcota bacterium]